MPAMLFLEDEEEEEEKKKRKSQEDLAKGQFYDDNQSKNYDNYQYIPLGDFDAMIHYTIHHKWGGTFGMGHDSSLGNLFVPLSSWPSSFWSLSITFDGRRPSRATIIPTQTGPGHVNLSMCAVYFINEQPFELRYIGYV
ncbi:hypothetical protein OUZ56_013840 [Daphnia magna]|uniref:Uncharacterized protein n=1 Tax=Daphnia magna TaxID=35525 RepID=A0ABQ9Z733_9CRUS|nr:hypothetical protein OUZ56_013840 [Daphnia magna]